jgi:hypothetical protein
MTTSAAFARAACERKAPRGSQQARRGFNKIDVDRGKREFDGFVLGRAFCALHPKPKHR